MSSLLNTIMVIVLFMALVPLVSSFYTNMMESNSKTPIDMGGFTNTSIMRQLTTDAINTTQNTQQPSAPTALDFFFSLPAVFLQATTTILFTLFETPVAIAGFFAEVDAATGVPVSLLGGIVGIILSLVLTYKIIGFMRGKDV